MNIDKIIKETFIESINDNVRTIGVEIEMPIISHKRQY